MFPTIFSQVLTCELLRYEDVVLRDHWVAGVLEDADADPAEVADVHHRAALLAQLPDRRPDHLLPVLHLRIAKTTEKKKLSKKSHPVIKTMSKKKCQTSNFF